MAADNSLLDRVMSLLDSIGGIASKPMFGGYGIFHNGDMFALIKGNGLFFKVDDSNRAAYEQAGSKQYKPMPYFQVPDEVLDDHAKLVDWARISISIARASSAKKRRQ